MSTLTTAPADRPNAAHHRPTHDVPSSSNPIWTLNVLRGSELVRRITVLAPSSEAALFKGREQLDDGETLSFCFTTPASEFTAVLVQRPRHQPQPAKDLT